jgi:uncharacterized protein DUF6230
MSDSQQTSVQGRTRWRRFAALSVPAVIAVGGIMFGLTNGAIAASLDVSGQSFKVSADKLVGTGFAQFSGQNKLADGTLIPVAESAIGHAELTNLCQSVKVPNLPIVLRIEAGKDPKNPATADNMLIGMSSLSGDAVFEKIQIGVDGQEASGDARLAGTFAQVADKVTITNLKQVATSTSAGTFSLTGLSLRLLTGSDAVECF